MATGNALIHLAVFGSPVRHSLSPRIHGLFAEQAGLDVDYRAIEAPAGSLAAALQTFSGQGCNITAPLKGEAMQLAGSHSDAVIRAGAANTLTRQADGSWQADTTDGPGLLTDLERLGHHPSGSRVAVVGAGGATASVLGALLLATPESITLYNRTLERAQALAHSHSDLGECAVSTLDQLAEDHGYDLLINATTLGHGGQLPPLRAALLAPGGILYDMNYGPAHVPLAEWCAANQVQCHGGLGMLVGQAAVSFEIWTGFRPLTTPVIEALSA